MVLFFFNEFVKHILSVNFLDRQKKLFKQNLDYKDHLETFPPV